MEHHQSKSKQVVMKSLIEIEVRDVQACSLFHNNLNLHAVPLAFSPKMIM
jgi:hypothetical protein